MKILTSNFSSVKKFPLTRFLPIGIAQWPPKFFTGESLKQLAPPDFLIRGYKSGDIDNDEYVLQYNKHILKNLDVPALIETLQKMCGQRIPVLCCYEKSGDFCHRNLVAMHLRSHGHDTHEATVEDISPSQSQCSLMEM